MRPELRYCIDAWNACRQALARALHNTCEMISVGMIFFFHFLLLRVQGAKSLCFRVPGAPDVKQASGKVVPVPDAKTLMCARKHGGVPCCSGEWRTDSTRVVNLNRMIVINLQIAPTKNIYRLNRCGSAYAHVTVLVPTMGITVVLFAYLLLGARAAANVHGLFTAFHSIRARENGDH